MDEIETIMQEKERLLRKYHCNTIDEVIQHLRLVITQKNKDTP